MTRAGAYAEAKRRWGRTAAIEERPLKDGGKVFSVGRIACGIAFMVMGSGRSWEEAFAQAEKRLGG